MKPLGSKNKVSEIPHAKRSARRILTVAACLALVVTLGILGALPGEGWTRPGYALECHFKAHQHTAACRDEGGQLICGRADYAVHVHNEDCYDGEELVCEIPEEPKHTHTEQCYQSERTLVCGRHIHTAACYDVSPCEREEHEHSEECYAPAKAEQTFEQRLTCGQGEHAHSEKCYAPASEPSCGVKAHTHDDSCYTTVTVSVGSEEPDEQVLMTCNQEQHAHSEECYPRPSEPNCGSREHAHDDNCYTEVAVTVGTDRSELICGKEEHSHGDDALGSQEPNCGYDDHTHNSECYEEERALVCGKQDTLHRHSDSCYEMVPLGDGSFQKALTCGLLELTEHVHTIEGCFVEKDAEEDGLMQAPEEAPEEVLAENKNTQDIMALEDVSDIQALKDGKLSNDAVTFVLWRVNASGNLEKIEPGTDLAPYLGERIMVQVKLKDGVPLDKDELQKCNGRIEFELPPYFDLNESPDGKLIYNGNEIGTISTDPNTGKVTLCIDEQFISDENNQEFFGLYFNVQGWFNWDEIDHDDTDRTVFGEFPVGADLTWDQVLAKYSPLTLHKEVAQKAVDENGDCYIEYKLTLKAGKGGATDVKVTDALFKSDRELLEQWVDIAKTYGGNIWSEETSSETPFNPGTVRGSVSDNTLLWEIGSMEPNEERTLTYRVYLNREYVDTIRTGSITNDADATTKEGMTASDSAYANLGAGADLKKAAKQTKNADGSVTLTYTITLHGHEANDHALDILLTDSLFEDFAGSFKDKVTSRDLLQYLKYSDIQILDQSGRAIDPSRIELKAKEGEYSVTINDLMPGETVTITYTITVDAAALDGRDVQVRNSAQAKTTGGDLLASDSSDQKVSGSERVKKTGSKLSNKDGVIRVEGGDVYEIINNKIVKMDSYDSDFSLEDAGYQYTVRLHGGADEDVTGWLMEDTLTNMEYVGYVKVAGKAADGTERTAWVKVDGRTGFKFTAGDLGFTGEGWEFVLTYYTKVTGTEDQAIVKVKNEFDFNGFHDEWSDDADGDLNLDGAKQGWYYAPDEGENGTLYWVIEVNADKIPANTLVRDALRSRPKDQVYPNHPLVGVYFGASGTDFKKYDSIGSFNEALSRDGFSPLEKGGNYEVISGGHDNNGNDVLDIKFLRLVEVPAGKSLYIVVKTVPISDPYAAKGGVTFKNDLLINGKDKPDATITVTKVDGVAKDFGALFSADGYGGGKLIDASSSDLKKRWGSTIMKTYEDGNGKNLSAGLYAAWLVTGNPYGDLQGVYDIVDTIPAGMKLKSVVLIDIGQHDTRNRKPDVTPSPSAIQGSGWESRSGGIMPPEKASVTSNYNAFYEWPGWTYYTSGNQVKWRVCWPRPYLEGKTDPVKYAYYTTFMVVCQITDEDILLGSTKEGVTSKGFDNTVEMFNENGNSAGKATAHVDIECQGQLSKEILVTKRDDAGNAITSNVVEFTITVNENKLDLTMGSRITITDTMSPNLRLLRDSIEVRTENGELFTDYEVDITYPVKDTDPTVINIDVPDNLLLYIHYKAQIEALPEATVEIQNTAGFYGRNMPDRDNVVREEFQYFPDGGLDVTKRTSADVEIEKISKRTEERLAGAEFTLYVWDEESKAFVIVAATADQENPVTTKAEGIARFASLSVGTVYCLKETGAPDGYLADYLYYFVIVNTDEMKQEYQAWAKAHANEMGGSDLHIEFMTSDTVSLTAVNSRNKITGTKRFLDENGEAMNNLPAGTYSFGLYVIGEGGVETEYKKAGAHYVKTIKVPEDAAADGSYSFTFEDLDPGETYYVYELDADGNKIANGGSWQMSGTTFKTTYENQEINAGNNESYTVAVTNRATEVYKLPETGGDGGITAILYMAGAMAVTGLGVLTIIKKRPRKQN